jgi:large subunit ribosomal protein L21
MYAVIQASGKQYKVSKEQIISVDRMQGSVGDKIEFPNVLFASENGKIKLGTPVIEGAVVKAEIVEHLRGEKIIVFKKKRRKNYRRKQGHRQDLTNLKIKEITLGN